MAKGASESNQTSDCGRELKPKSRREKPLPQISIFFINSTPLA